MDTKMQTKTKRPMIILTGPTAVGKTAASIELANGSRRDVPRNLARNYTRFRIGLSAMMRNWLHGLFAHDDGENAEEELESVIERFEREEELGTSLVNLIAQTRA